MLTRWKGNEVLDKPIYAVFEYYGDGELCAKNALCFKYGQPEEILQWLLTDGYLFQVYQFGQYIGTKSDEKYLKQIAQLCVNRCVMIETIASIDLRMPSCCTCRAISAEVEDMKDFVKTVKKLLASDKIDTIAKGEELEKFMNALEKAAKTEEDYQAFSSILPERYL